MSWSMEEAKSEQIEHKTCLQLHLINELILIPFNSGYFNARDKFSVF